MDQEREDYADLDLPPWTAERFITLLMRIWGTVVILALIFAAGATVVKYLATP